ncbi:MAG: ComF family protein [Gammaproteobacteria bacterium]
MLKKVLKQFTQNIFPATCILCSSRSDLSVDICRDCFNDLPVLQQACIKCANILQGGNTQEIVCGQCLKTPPPFNRTVALFHYQHPVNHLLTALKFHGKLTYGRLLGQLMAQYLQQVYTDVKHLPQCIIPMPLHYKRLKSRGFNQALELAQPIAQCLKLPLNYTHCQRIKATTPQMLIPAKERKKNVNNAFQVKPLRIKHIALVDDIMTTGHTAAQMSKVLLKSGVEKIDLWCCARTHSNYSSFRNY